MRFPANALEFMDLMVSEHKVRLRSRRPAGETLRYMGETLDEHGRGEEFLKLWVHNPAPKRTDPNDPETDLAMLQLYEHWRRFHKMRPIEPWDGTRLRPWLSSKDNPSMPSVLAGDLSAFADAMTRSPDAEVPWRRLDAFGHAIEAYFTQLRRHSVWARPSIRPAAKTSKSGPTAHVHSLDSHNLASASTRPGPDIEHKDHPVGHAAAGPMFDRHGDMPGGELRLYYHNELNNLETAPYSVRFWGFLKWASDLRKRLLGLEVAAFPHDQLSDIAFADQLAMKHFAWHDDVFSMGSSPRWDDQLGRYQTHRYPMGSQGYGVEFFQFHRDLVDYYNEWLVAVGRTKATAWLSGKHHTAYVMKYAGETWWGRAGSYGRCLSPEGVAPELMDPNLTSFDTLAELGHYLDVGWPTFHGVGHVQNCDIRDPYCNNYSIRFFGWHLWLDELFRVLEAQGKPLFDKAKGLSAPIERKWTPVPTPPNLIEGIWTYRSFHNDPDPKADPRWFVASLQLRQREDGTLHGRLDSGDPDYIYDVDGFLDESPMRYELEPEWWDDRLAIVLHARGATAATKGHEYRYAAFYQPRFPDGRAQAKAFVGSVLRFKRPDDHKLEGTVGTFMAVWRAPLPDHADHSGPHAEPTQIFVRTGEFVVPAGVHEIHVRAWGGGGGGGSDGPGLGTDNGQSGTASSVMDWLRAGGGVGGQHGVFQVGEGGIGGVGIGGVSNVSGEAGEKGGTVEGESGRGGAAPGDGGGQGGTRVGRFSSGFTGGYPGGGGSGAQEGKTPGGGGGAGAYVEGQYRVVPGARISVIVGVGGKGGDGGFRVGGAGAPGLVEITWANTRDHSGHTK
jgi:hypothetical protein